MPNPIPSIGHGLTVSFNMVVVPAKSVTLPSYSCEKKDVTTLADTSHQYIPALRDAGEATAKFNYDGSNSGLLGFITALGGTTETLLFTFPDGATWTSSAWVSKYELADVSPDEPLELTISWQSTGDQTQVIGS